MNSFPGDGKHLGNNIPLSQGKLEQEAATANRKDISECQTNPGGRSEIKVIIRYRQ